MRFNINMQRWWEIDALRGLMLILMTLTHLPTHFSGPFGQPLGFVSAAEGFVFLSAFMAGHIFTRRAARDGIPAMRRAILRRALKIYGCHVAMLAFLFTIIAAIGITTNRQAIKNLIAFYLQEPVTAMWSSLILLYNPPLLDILPLYVVFMLLSPWMLMVGLRLGWPPVLAISLLLWACAQFGLEKEIYEAISAYGGLKVPFSETGAFDVLAWQLIWTLGLSMGSRGVSRPISITKLPGFFVGTAALIALTGLIWRHVAGQAAFGADGTLNLLFDKWHLGPLRIVNFLALLLLTLRFGSLVSRAFRFRFLEVLGAASLPVFCVHLGVVLLALAAVGDSQGSTSLWLDLALLASTFCLLYATAWLFGTNTSRPAGMTASSVKQNVVSARAAR
jgi:hypothetical protein